MQSKSEHANAYRHAEPTPEEIPHRATIMSGKNRYLGRGSGGLWSHGA